MGLDALGQTSGGVVEMAVSNSHGSAGPTPSDDDTDDDSDDDSEEDNDSDDDCDDGDLACEITTEEGCLALGGTFQGVDTECFDPAGNSGCVVDDEDDDVDDGRHTDINRTRDTNTGPAHPSLDSPGASDTGANSQGASDQRGKKGDHGGRRRPTVRR